MSEPPIPRLRPYARQGKPYYAELRAILRTEGNAIVEELRAYHRGGGKITPLYLGRLALRHRLNFKATCEWLAERGCIPTGTYDKITAVHRPSAVLRAAMDEETNDA